MCKAGQAKSGGGVLQRMRYLHGQIPSAGDVGPSNRAGAKGEQGERGEDGHTLPPLPPILRMLSADVLTDACTLLDAPSLATAAAVCRAFRDVCQGPYPWKRLCLREWGLAGSHEEGSASRAGGVGRAAAAAAAAVAEGEGAAAGADSSASARAAAGSSRKKVRLHDSICQGDFRRLFLMIEQMPTGFDCSLLRDSSDQENPDPNAVAAAAAPPNNNNAAPAHNADNDNDNGGQNGDDDGDGAGGGDAGDAAPPAAAVAAAPAAPAGAAGEGAGDEGAAVAAAGAIGDANNQAPPPPAPAAAADGVGARPAARAARVEEAGEEAEEEAGDFLIKGVKRWPTTKAASLLPSPAGASASAEVTAASATAAAATAAGSEGGRPRSSSGDVALQVEFRGGLGVGNRCVRADLPLPSTVLRERTGVGARSSLARRLETSPLALFRWLLAKMAAAATASASAGGVGSGGGGGGGVYGTGPADAWSSAQQRLFGNHFQHRRDQQQAGHVEEGPEVNGGGGGNADGAGTMPGGWGEGAVSDGGVGVAGTGERRERSSSLPAGGARDVGGGGARQEKPTLPRVLCYPVSLGKGVVDVTPRLVSYFEVTIMTPRVDPPHAIPDCIAIGVSESLFPLKGKMPGWDARSYGYHSDDGGAFHDAGSMLFKCGPSFGPGDVVGCGLDYSAGEEDTADIFFTLNGEALTNSESGGSAAFRGVKGTFYPTVGVDSACPVRINLGGEAFKFDLVAALRRGGQETAARESVAQHEPRCSRPSPSLAASGASSPETLAAELPGDSAPTAGTPAAAPDLSRVSKGPSSDRLPSSMPKRSRQHSLPSQAGLQPQAGASSGRTAGSSSNPNVAWSY